MDFVGIVGGGIPIEQLAREGRGAIKLISPSSEGEERAAGAYELLGYSPYVIKNRILTGS